MKTAPMHNFHLPLPADVYEGLRDAARRLSVPATQLARQAVEEWVRRQRVNAVHEELASYAQAHVGTAADLDEILEGAAIEHLVNEETKP
ncbi:hypothetical protein [Geobacter grbiciae]|uniref:hypothetical protein n=1 Tax=Geobacter grbiciae TaxID=155042 RepID=UPI001C02618D|nr:hypothetical protein [Geobacter grbiciae]MBT1074920.1 hypothetical protein [Geobacter grbiciae]